MECAKQRGLKVIMSGQGADEIFLGYRKYWILSAIADQARPVFYAMGSSRVVAKSNRGQSDRSQRRQTLCACCAKLSASRSTTRK